MQEFTPSCSGQDGSPLQALSSENNHCLHYYGYPPPTTPNRLQGDFLLNPVTQDIPLDLFNCYDPLQNLSDMPRGNVNSGITYYANGEAQYGFSCSEEQYATTPCVQANNQEIASTNSAAMSLSLSLFSRGARAPIEDSDCRPATSSHTGDSAQVCSAYKRDEAPPSTSGVLKCRWAGCMNRDGFSRESVLIRHIKSVHISPDRYKCLHEYCDKSFGRKDKLRAHMKMVHS